MAWRGKGRTDIGLIRSSNQDTFAVLDALGVWIVADSMGGQAGGDIASRLAVESIAAFLMAERGTARGSRGAPQENNTMLRRAIASANHVIRQEAIKSFERSGMGTTVVMASIGDGPPPVAHVAHVGDSRAYLLRERALLPLTRDHSLVEESVRQGLLSPEEAAGHPRRHVLTRALGIAPQVEPDVSTHPLHPDDLILLCTDGLTKMLDDRDILEMIVEISPSAEAICEALVREANRRGGADNVTIVVIRHEEGK